MKPGGHRVSARKDPLTHPSGTLSPTGEHVFGGARPSSAAATLGDSGALNRSKALTIFCISAPGDGRTPVNTYTGEKPRGEGLRRMGSGSRTERLVARWHAGFAFLSTLVLLGTSPWAGFSAAPDPALLDRAFAQLQSHQWGQPADALLALDEAIAATPNDPASRLAFERRLVAILQTNAPVAARQLACRKLALMGSRHAVPALASLLTQEDLSHMARFALERIPDTSAAAALREALPQAHGQLKPGLINSLGAVSDASATPALIPLLRDADRAVVGAAASALGQIGTLEAVRALESFRARAAPPLQPLVNDALVAGVENLARHGERPEAARIFRQLYERETGMLRLAGFRGLVQAEPEQADALLLQALAGHDEPLRRLAARLLSDRLGDQTLKPFLEAWKSLPADGQVALLEVVRSRRDPNAYATVLAACDSRELAVRRDAVRALGVVGTAHDVPRLARLTTSGPSDERESARLALAALPGREPTQAIAALLPTAASPLRVELIRVLAARGATDAAPQILPHLHDSDATTRRVALEAIATLGDEQQAPAVIAFLKTAPDDAARGQAEKTLSALVTRTGQKCLESLLAGLADTPPAARLILLEQLGSLGGSRALTAVRAAVDSEDAGLREGAFRVLAAWPEWDAAPDLLRVAHESNQGARRALAFRGYVRLCREAPMASSRRLARLTEAAECAATTDEKVLVVSALAEVPEAGSLKLLATYLNDGAVVDAASAAAVKAASALDARHREAVAPVLQQVLRVCRNAEVQRRAREVLTKLGVPSE